MCCLTKHPFLVGVPMEFQVEGPQQSPGRGFIEKFLSLKRNSSHLKMDGWNTIVSFSDPAYLQGCFSLLLSGRGGGFKSFLGPFASIPQDYGVCYNGTTTSIDIWLSCFKENLFVVTPFAHNQTKCLHKWLSFHPQNCKPESSLFSGLAVVNPLIIRRCFFHVDRFLGWCFLSRIRVTMVMTSHH